MKLQVLIFTILLLFVSCRKPIDLLRSKISIDFPSDFHTRRSLEEIVTLIVTFQKHPTESDLNQISDLCEHSHGHYLGQKSYTIKTYVQKIKQIQKHPLIQHVGLYKPDHRYLDIEHRFDILTERLILHKDNDPLKFMTEPHGPPKPKKETPKEDEFDFNIFSILLEPSSHRKSVSTPTQELVSQIRSSPLNNNEIKVHPVSEEKLMIRISKRKTDQLKQFLSHQHQVHSFYKYRFPTTKNKDAKWILETNQKHVYLDSTRYNGAGQLLAIGDSGLDTNNCFFYDSSIPAPFQTQPSPQTTDALSPHRKISWYWTFMDSGVRDSSHGTHCSGTIAGSWNNGPSVYNGISPNAKLYFADLGCSTNGGCQCSTTPGCPCVLLPDQTCPNCGNCIFPPNDLGQYYFSAAYDSGARVMSNSWGGDSIGYSQTTMEIDKFVWEHPDFLPFFAAGNAGDNYFFSSLDTEAECKNCLTVGATENAEENFETIYDTFLDFEARKSQFLGELVFENYCNNLQYYNTCMGGVTPQKEAYCDWIQSINPKDFDCCDEGEKEPRCNLTTKSDQCGCEGVKLPWQAISGKYCCRKCYIEQMRTADQKITYTENMAYFSSLGPTFDGRFKPDVSAPGFYLISAKGKAVNQTCLATTPEKEHITYMAGTSMATPATTGSLGLLRQYIQDDLKVAKPTAALMKAMIINSGEKMSGMGYVRGRFTRLQPELRIENSDPEMDARFFYGVGGRIKLNNVIMPDSIKNSLFFKEEEEIQSGDYHYYCFNKKTSKSSVEMETNLKITLVWTDYPSVVSKRRHLVNDLNVLVKFGEEERDFMFGNADEKNMIRRDSINNVEQMEIFVPSTDSEKNEEKFVVVVEGAEVPMNPQGYALVIRSLDQTELEVFECENEDKDLSELGANSATNGDEWSVSDVINGVVIDAILVLNIFILLCLCCMFFMCCCFLCTGFCICCTVCTQCFCSCNYTCLKEVKEWVLRKTENRYRHVRLNDEEFTDPGNLIGGDVGFDDISPTSPDRRDEGRSIHEVVSMDHREVQEMRETSGSSLNIQEENPEDMSKDYGRL